MSKLEVAASIFFLYYKSPHLQQKQLIAMSLSWSACGAADHSHSTSYIQILSLKGHGLCKKIQSNV
jgi:hypothetical protein